MKYPRGARHLGDEGIERGSTFTKKALVEKEELNKQRLVSGQEEVNALLMWPSLEGELLKGARHQRLQTEMRERISLSRILTFYPLIGTTPEKGWPLQKNLQIFPVQAFPKTSHHYTQCHILTNIIKERGHSCAPKCLVADKFNEKDVQNTGNHSNAAFNIHQTVMIKKIQWNQVNLPFSLLSSLSLYHFISYCLNIVIILLTLSCKGKFQFDTPCISQA